MRFRQWFSRLARVVPSEERDGIHMMGPCWEVHGQVDHCAFLRALPSVVPENAILFLEGGRHPPAVRDFIEANAVPAAATVRRGTVWPKETVFHLPATTEVLNQLADLGEHCADPVILHGGRPAYLSTQATPFVSRSRLHGDRVPQRSAAWEFVAQHPVPDVAFSLREQWWHD